MGFADLVEILLKSNAHLEAPTQHKATALYLAVSRERTSCVQALLEAGASAITLDVNGFAPIHLAAHYGFTDILRLILSHGADPMLESVTGDRALHLACYGKHQDAVAMLAQAMRSVDVRDKELRTPIHYCAQRGNIRAMEFLSSPPYSADLRATDAYKDTPLHIACYFGQFDAVRFLVERGAIDYRAENIYSETALHAACTFGRSVELVAYLLRVPAIDVNVQGHDGHTALHSACFNDHLQISELLLESGADLT